MKLWTVLLIGLLSTGSVALGQDTQSQTGIESQTEATVFVIGAARMPGAYSLMDAASLLNALKVSGGLQADANSSAIVIIRPVNEATPNTKHEQFTVSLREVLSGKSPDFQLKAHDIVWIPTYRRRER